MAFGDRIREWLVKGMDLNAFLHTIALDQVTGSGVSVTADSAMREPTVFACARTISQIFASIPKILYTEDPKTHDKEKAYSHPAYVAVHDAPNEFQSSFQFWEWAILQMLLHGNAYAIINRTSAKIELLPVPAPRVTATQLKDFTLQYKIDTEDRIRTNADLLHIPWTTMDGFLGVPPIYNAREEIGASLAAARLSSLIYANNALPGGVVIAGEKLTDEKLTEFKKRWAEGYSQSNAFKTAVLGLGWDYKQNAIDLTKLQFLETIRFLSQRICGVFGVPPPMIGDLERATFSNIENLYLQFRANTIYPLVSRVEQAISRALLTPQERRSLTWEFLIDDALRADARSRFACYQIGIQNRMLLPNEARAKENWQPIPGGDEFPNTTPDPIPGDPSPPDQGGKTNA